MFISRLDEELTMKTTEANRLREILDEQEKESQGLIEKSAAINKTLDSTARAVSDATHDRDVHFAGVKQIRDDMKSTDMEIRILDLNLTRVSSNLKMQQNTIARLHERLAQLAKSADELDRLHTEYMADVAEISRRIAEKVDVISELEISRKSTEEAVNRLKSRVHAKLDKLEQLNRNLRQETQTRVKLVRQINGVKDTLRQMQCSSI
jgi:chromosome segregation ATPase